MKLARYATITLAFMVITILFGAFVRATGSGAGCGSHWPSCGGVVIPRSPSAETAIEFTHRATSGILLLMVAVLLIWVLRTTQQGSPVRLAAIGAAVFIVFEALVGAALVLFEWVGDDDSPERAAVVAVHLVNTFILLAAVTLTAWFAAGNPAPRRPSDRATRRWVLWCAVGLLVVGSTGAIAALGDTLFPPETLVQGLRDDFAGVLLQRLRWIHPVVAVLTAIAVMRFAARHQGEAVGAGLLISLVVGQLALGVVNVLLLAPVWMQLVHLFVADLVWIVFVITATSALVARGAPSHPVRA
jgi:heme A synthase